MVSRKANRDEFVQVPLWWAEQAVQATKTPQAMVWLWLLHLSWKEHSRTFKLPNGRLAVRGVNRFAKNRALQNLEMAGLIQMTKGRGKSPTVTLDAHVTCAQALMYLSICAHSLSVCAHPVPLSLLLSSLSCYVSQS
jgi:hypothetical protein